jgi:hypothetical protein
MGSSRHWNVERHIGQFHDGHGKIMGFMEYIIEVQAGRLARPTYPRRAHPVKTRTVMEVVLAHSAAITESRRRLLEEMRISKFSIPVVQGHICPRCISIIIDIKLKDNTAVLEPHKCSIAWLLDHEKIDKQRDLIIEELEEHIPQEMEKIQNTLSSGRDYTLFYSPSIAPHDADRMVARAIVIDPKLDLNVKNEVMSNLKALFDEAIRAGNWILCDIRKYEWARRAMKNNSTTIDRQELLEFFGLAKTSKCNIYYQEGAEMKFCIFAVA